MEIYNNIHLKYPLTINEFNIIDQVWNFINIFNIGSIYVGEYRNNIIKKIKKKYTIDQFYLYETIVNKLFWNLRHAIYPLIIYKNITKYKYYELINMNIPNTLLLFNKYSYNTNKEMLTKINDIIMDYNCYYKSFINKIIQIDKKNKIIYYKPMEGSSHIFSKNYFNLFTSTALMNRNIYESIMLNPYNIKNIHVKLPEFYYEYDYIFPNLNFCKYCIGDKKIHVNRIRKMYYYDTDMFWFKLL